MKEQKFGSTFAQQVQGQYGSYLKSCCDKTEMDLRGCKLQFF